MGIGQSEPEGYREGARIAAEVSEPDRAPEIPPALRGILLVGAYRIFWLYDRAGDEELVVPRGAVETLAQILAHMGAGQGVSIVP